MPLYVMTGGRLLMLLLLLSSSSTPAEASFTGNGSSSSSTLAKASFTGKGSSSSSTLAEASLTGHAGQPQQIHLSLVGDRPDCMIVTWSTAHATAAHVVFTLAHSSVKRSVQGTSVPLFDQAVLRDTQYIHRAAMCDLEMDAIYVYRVGDTSFGWSSELKFRTRRSSHARTPLTLAVYGDLGDTNSRSLGMIQEMVDDGGVDGVLHVGDFAYNLESNGGKVGDAFMNDIQPIASIVPYMTCPGNHESGQSFNHYRSRLGTGFSLVGEPQMYYSFNMGNAHFVSLSTELYWFDMVDAVRVQHEWLVADLIKANAARQTRPWIVVMAHRPPYCSNLFGDCTFKSSRVRTGLLQADGTRLYGLEQILTTHGVDIAFWGHQHTYERMYPISNYVMKKGSEDDPYVNPKGTVHVVTGSAGCKEQLGHFRPKQPKWSARRSHHYGFTMVRIYNDSHLHLQQISAEHDTIDNAVIDDVWLIQSAHGPFIDPITIAVE